jgi:hypothetical protein
MGGVAGAYGDRWRSIASSHPVVGMGGVAGALEGLQVQGKARVLGRCSPR